MLYLDIKKLKSFFDIVVIMFDHEDCRDIHEILTKFEKIIVMYPNSKFNKIEMLNFIAEKYGFVSEIFAEKFLKAIMRRL